MKDETEEVRWVEKLVWDKDRVPEFLEILTSIATQAEITHARAIVSTDVNLAIHAFVECLRKESACMVRKIKIGGTRKTAEWFDQDCFIHRKQCRAKSRCAYTKLFTDKKKKKNSKEKRLNLLLIVLMTQNSSGNR